MTHSPENDGVHPPEEVLEALRDRALRLQALLGQLTTEMGGLAKDLGSVIGAPHTPHTPPAEIPPPKDVEVFTPFSSIQQQAERSQQELERISLGDHELPQCIQSIFYPTLTYFQTALKSVVNPQTDPKIARTISRKSLSQMPDYQDTKAWSKALERHAQLHEWQDSDAEKTFGCSFGVEYVPLGAPDTSSCDQSLQLVGYSFGYWKGQHGTNFELAGEECRRVGADITVADGIVKIAKLTRYKSDQDYPIEETHDFTTNKIIQKAGYNGSLTTTYDYDPQEYSYSNGHEVLPADKVLAYLRSHMRKIAGNFS